MLGRCWISFQRWSVAEFSGGTKKGSGRKMVSARHVEQWPLVTCAHTLATGVKTHSPWFLGRFTSQDKQHTRHHQRSRCLTICIVRTLFSFHAVPTSTGFGRPPISPQPYHHHERPLSIDADWSFFLLLFLSDFSCSFPHSRHDWYMFHLPFITECALFLPFLDQYFHALLVSRAVCCPFVCPPLGA